MSVGVGVCYSETSEISEASWYGKRLTKGQTESPRRAGRHTAVENEREEPG